MPASSVQVEASQSVLAKTLIINEIFYSIQGESTKTGLPTSFIRLTGCPLRCRYCDTEYAFYEGKKMSFSEIMQAISAAGSRHVTVTGGEPLAQSNCLALLTFLCDNHYHASLETGGAINVAQVDKRVVKILDLKTPGSGEAEKNLFENLQHLHNHDQVKFVICDEKDYAWSKQIIRKYALTEKTEILLSPSYRQLPATELADWILTDHLPVRLQIQLHKHLWGDKRGV